MGINEDTEVKFINMGKIRDSVLPFANHDTAMKNSYMSKNLHKAIIKFKAM